MKTWENNVRKVVPYVPGEQPNKEHMIKLNTNENPYPPAPGVQKVLEDFQVDRLRLYPDPVIGKLVGAIADNYGVKKEQVFVGVGSDDVLAMIFMTFFNSSTPILFPDITYSFYDVWADMLRIPYKQIPLDEDFCIRPNDYTQESGGIIFPNPNAPTGELLGLEAVEEIIKANPDVIVVVDEAYIDFGGESALPLIDTYDNLIVVQTFSKSKSMAGMRIGMAIASKELIKALNDVKYSVNSYTMNMPSLIMGTAAAKSNEYYKEITAKIVATRERTVEELNKLDFECLPSGANFVFAKHKSIPGVDIYEYLRQNKVFVRRFNAPRIEDYLRITIGTDLEMDRLHELLKEYVSL